MSIRHFHKVNIPAELILAEILGWSCSWTEFHPKTFLVSSTPTNIENIAESSHARSALLRKRAHSWQLQQKGRQGRVGHLYLETSKFSVSFTRSSYSVRRKERGSRRLPPRLNFSRRAGPRCLSTLGRNLAGQGGVNSVCDRRRIFRNGVERT